MNGYVQVNQTLIIGWALMGSNPLSQINPYEHLQSGGKRIENKSLFFIGNRQNLCKHGGLNIMTAQKGKYIPVNLYISMKETFINNW